MEQMKMAMAMVKINEFLLKSDKKVIEHYAKYNKRIHIVDEKIIVSFGEYDITLFYQDEELYTLYLHGYYKKYHTIMSEMKTEQGVALWYGDKKFNYYARKGDNKINVQLNGMYKNVNFSTYNEDGTPGTIENLQDLKKFSKSVDKELCEELILSK